MNPSPKEVSVNQLSSKGFKSSSHDDLSSLRKLSVDLAFPKSFVSAWTYGRS